MDSIEQAFTIAANDPTLPPAYLILLLLCLAVIGVLSIVCVKLHRDVGKMWTRHADELRRIQEAQQKIISDQMGRHRND